MGYAEADLSDSVDIKLKRNYAPDYQKLAQTLLVGYCSTPT